MENPDFETLFTSPVLARIVERLSEGIAGVAEATEGAMQAPISRAEFGDRVIGTELASLIVGTAWNNGGDWNGRFALVMAAAMRVPPDINPDDGAEEKEAYADALENVRKELKGCPQVSEGLALSLAFAVSELSELLTPGISENEAARHALVGAIGVGMAYAAPKSGSDEVQGPAGSITAMFRDFGKAGADVTHAPTRALKAWALAKADTMKGADRAIARELADSLPPEFIGKSDDPTRLIYEALRARKRTANS